MEAPVRRKHGRRLRCHRFEGGARFSHLRQGIEPALEALEPALEEAVASCSALELGSNTLLGRREREISERARELALESGRPLLVDVNLRLQRWKTPAQAVKAVRSLCSGAFLVKVNAAEAGLMTGNDDPAHAAEAICAELGARIAVVTLGAEGALVRGEARADAPGVAARVVDTTGAGDVLLGVLVAALARSHYDPGAAARLLPFAVSTAARSTESYGAVDALTDAIDISRIT